MKHRVNVAAWCCAAGWVAVAASLAWSLWNSQPLPHSLTPVRAIRSHEAPPEEGDRPRPPEIVWADPRSSKGALRELFTPPWLQADGASTHGTGSPSTRGTLPASSSSKWPELVEVREELYPLQLIGFTGSGKHAGGIFELTASGETMVAREGHMFAGLGLELVALEVKRPRSSAARGEGSAEWQANALVRDALSGASVRLESQRRHLSSAVALLRLPGTDDLRLCRSGDVVSFDELSFTVVRVQATPPAVELTRGQGSTQTHRIELPANLAKR